MIQLYCTNEAFTDGEFTYIHIPFCIHFKGRTKVDPGEFTGH